MTTEATLLITKTEEEYKMNIYEKIQKIRVELQEMGLKKSGRNTFANYDYYELGDFLPQLKKLMEEHKLSSTWETTPEITSLIIVNAEKPEEKALYSCQTSSAKLKLCHDVQNMGAVITYTRRYLYQLAFDIVEQDALDKTHNPNTQEHKSSNSSPKKQETTAASSGNDNDLNKIIEKIKSQETVEEAKKCAIDEGTIFEKGSRERKAIWATYFAIESGKSPLTNRSAEVQTKDEEPPMDSYDDIPF